MTTARPSGSPRCTYPNAVDGPDLAPLPAKDAAPAGHDPLLGAHPEERFRELRRRIAVEA